MGKRQLRCGPLFAQAITWLRKHGVQDTKALHSLRKDAGSLVFEATYSADRAADFIRNDPRTAPGALYWAQRQVGDYAADDIKKRHLYRGFDSLRPHQFCFTLKISYLSKWQPMELTEMHNKRITPSRVVHMV